MRELRQLRLPRLVEAKNRHSASSELERTFSEGNTNDMSRSSTSSDCSPVSPTFSLQGQSRFLSSTSSLASLPTMRTSVEDHPTKQQRPLTEVREETHEGHGDFEMVEAPTRHSEESMPNVESTALSTRLNDQADEEQADYDWDDTTCHDDEFDFTTSKRRCDRSPSVAENATARINGSIRNLSRKLRSRKERRISSIPDSFHESIVTRSRASSVRSPSAMDGRDSVEHAESRIFAALTPSESFTEFSPPPEVPASPVDARADPRPLLEEEEYEDEEQEITEESASRTPLLPPCLAVLTDEKPVQSPLQSPKVAESPRDPFDNSTPWHGLPSPPLSAKPSISSFHHRQIVPPSEIPPITLADPQDEWSYRMGHSNFSVEPQPYLPTLPATVASCEQLRADWDEARRNYTDYHARIRAYYPATSKVPLLTEHKWGQIDACWKRYHEQALASVESSQPAEPIALSYESIAMPKEALTKIPSIIVPQNEGKFPKVGDLGIVGPMLVQKPAAAVQRPSMKRGFKKFWHDIQDMWWPSGAALKRSTSG